MKIRVVEIKNKQEALQEIAAVGADKPGCRFMTPKAVFRVLKIYDVEPKQANILKQEMLSKGGEAAVARGVVDASVDKSDVLLMGTLKQYGLLVNKLKTQPFGLRGIAEKIAEVLDFFEKQGLRVLKCRDKELTIGERTLVMGVLNVTPDSFSDGGRYNSLDAAVERALQMVEEGADIIDLGGESTRPGHEPVGAEEEMARVLPVLERLLDRVPVPVSIDTSKSEVARRALEMGAHIINDQSALRGDARMAKVIAEYKAPVVMMHNQQVAEHGDLMGEIIDYFKESIDLATKAGADQEKIILDPGFGGVAFGKTPEKDLELIRRIGELRVFGLPLLLGTSRKSTIGKVLDLPVDERVEGTAATVALGIAYGVDIVRVHDVREMVRVARMSDAIVRGRNEEKAQ